MKKTLKILFIIGILQINIAYPGKDKTTKIEPKDSTNKVTEDKEIDEIKIPEGLNIEKAYEQSLEFSNINELKKAFKYMEYSADRDYFYAQVNLTYMLMNGDGCEQDLESALELCNLVIKRSNKKSNKAYENYNDNKEKHYHEIYREFKALWRDILTKMFIDEPETKLDLLSLLSSGQLQLENDDKAKKEDKEIPEWVKMMYV